MKNVRPGITGLLILLPVLIAVVFQPFPYPETISQTNRSVQFIDNSETQQIDPLLLLLNFEPWRKDLWEKLGREYL
ncbi:hypothetical protein, partial [Escherichia coli]|uniref:hypothetical protein n=1 Tax=Escherichia coli TaxID=562 RepID=UPI001AA16642